MNKLAAGLVAVGLGLTALLAGSVATGCATGGAAFGPDDDATTTAGGGGTGGGTGAGGATGTTTTSDNPCPIDCATISTPECQVAKCNEQIKQCEVVDADDGAPCDDGQFCTVDEVCTAGLCGGGAPNDCGLEAPPCTAVSCNEASKACGENPAADGSPCTPGDKCQVNATCTNGLCLGVEKDCFFAPVPNDCHVAKCNPQNGNCEPEPGNEGQACVDSGDLCTESKTCSNGACVGGSPKDCSSLTEGCFDGKCDTKTGQCFADPIAPGQPCAAASDDCNQGTCDMNGKCVANPVNEGKSCNDGLACTSGETCQAGVCTGGMASIDVYLFEDFSAGVSGWTTGTEWQIGPTKTSSGQVYGGPDPALDHTASNQDNRVAGVVLGGNANPVTHDYYWLESPPFDVSQAPSVYFEYWRWLNSDYLPFMENSVEVFDGTSWVNVWKTGSSPGVQDSSWAKMTHDLGAYKNAQMRVRFGFKIGSSGVYTVSQWNVDDVLVASGPCQ